MGFQSSNIRLTLEGVLSGVLRTWATDLGGLTADLTGLQGSPEPGWPLAPVYPDIYQSSSSFSFLLQF